MSSVINPHQDRLIKQIQSMIIGFFNGLSYILIITNILAKYSSNPTQQHLDHAKYVIRYLKGTKTKRIEFSSVNTGELQSHVKFPVDPNSIVSLSDANWRPQDQSKPGETRSLLSGFSFDLEVLYTATDECTKSLSQMYEVSVANGGRAQPNRGHHASSEPRGCWIGDHVIRGVICSRKLSLFHSKFSLFTIIAVA